MFGFSPLKLLVLIAIIAGIWYGFKYLSRGKTGSKRVDGQSDGGGSPAQSVDMEKCPDCGAFVILSEHHCSGKGDA